MTTSEGSARFVDADLRGARFVRADLSGAVMRGVDVRGLVWRSHWEKLGFTAGENRRLGRALQADRTTIVAVRTNREANVALHRAVWDEVGTAVASP